MVYFWAYTMVTTNILGQHKFLDKNNGYNT